QSGRTEMAVRLGTALLVGMLLPEDQVVSGEKARALFDARWQLGSLQFFEAAAGQSIFGGPFVLGDARQGEARRIGGSCRANATGPVGVMPWDTNGHMLAG